RRSSDLFRMRLELCKEYANGTALFPGRCKVRQKRHEPAQARHAEERPRRQEGGKPQAGDGHWSCAGAQEKQASPKAQVALSLPAHLGLGASCLGKSSAPGRSPLRFVRTDFLQPAPCP